MKFVCQHMVPERAAPEPEAPIVGPRFVAHREQKTFEDASAACEASGRQLASIHSEAEHKEIREVMGGGQYWIGLNDLKAEGKWEWTDGSKYDYDYFRPGEPNDWGRNEDCVHAHSSEPGQWNDNRCGATMSFVCGPVAGTSGGPDGRVAPVQPEKAEFVVHDAPKSWSAAKAACEADGHVLASIRSEEEQDELESKLAGKHYWIGLSDAREEGTFEWVDESALSYTNYNPGEPNNWGGREDCIHVDGRHGGWNDNGCGNSFSYVCRVVASA